MAPQARVRSVVCALVLILAVTPVLIAQDVSCTDSPSSGIYYFPGYGNACAYTGGGCTECYYGDGSGSCVTDGEWCKPRQDNRN
jgi:hypothetical protein